MTSALDAESVLAAAATALTERGERFSITCSYGVVTIPVEAARLEQALQIADRRLYGSKELTRTTQSVQIKDALIQVLAEQGADLVPHLSRVALLRVRLVLASGCRSTRSRAPASRPSSMTSERPPSRA